ncbi:hypothetical protein PXW71_26225, partial [Klebsiella pneumoniae]
SITSFSEEFLCHGFILPDTLPIGVRKSKVVLRGGITLVCGFSVPLYGSPVILSDTFPGSVRNSK